MATNTAKYNYKKVRKAKTTKEISPIPKFSFKSAVIIALTALITTLFLPNMLAMLGIDTRLSTLVLNAIFISMAVCYCQYFIETNKRFNSPIIKVYLGLAFTIGVISYFWLYIGLYM